MEDSDAIAERKVELLRVPRTEQLFDREEVLGRDASSVFPTESKAAAGLDPEAVREMLGTNTRFISETQLEDIKSQRGSRVEDGSLAADKPLVEVLREAKEAKEAAFQETWKQMKTGKNKPLDEEEAEFLGHIAEAEQAARRSVANQEAEELAAFQEAVRHQREAPRVAGPVAGPAAEPPPGHPAHNSNSVRAAAQPVTRKPPLISVKPVARTIVLAKRQAQPGAGGSGGGAEQTPDAKRQRGSPTGGGGSEPGLAGLLGAYSSSDGE